MYLCFGRIAKNSEPVHRDNNLSSLYPGSWPNTDLPVPQPSDGIGVLLINEENSKMHAPYEATFIPTTPTITSKAAPRRIRLALSPKNRIPITSVPTAPMPVHTT